MLVLMKVAEFLLQSLEKNGVEVIFGNPGTTEIPLVRACERLEREGLSEGKSAYIFTQICRASAISIELMKLGNASLFRDLIDDPEDKNKDDNNE